MPKKSAGLLVFRGSPPSLEVLLVHPGGPFWSKKDHGAWSIPKGELGDNEAPLAAAIREFEEETGQPMTGEFVPLAPITQASGKTVFAWAVRGEFDPTQLRSNTFRMEWPPRSGRQQEFPEIDRASWFDIELARRKILDAQKPLLDDLLKTLESARQLF